MNQTNRSERSFVNGVEDLVDQIESQRIPNEQKVRQLSAVRQKLYERKFRFEYEILNFGIL